ncbi:MAG: hypothetical protein J5U17_11955 [Candidatus Methanoperedens sp.]|nr:hypothetical protein [Candidatus Methanoperedens sp.]MCE8428040.1 hypothetical protein [Candidatus Methanoperedens sp.]
MKIREVIKEFVPCEICGNNDMKNFYFHVLVDKGSQPYVKCCECEEEYYSTTARNILAGVEETRKVRMGTRITIKNRMDASFRKQENIHPLVKVLANM